LRLNMAEALTCCQNWLKPSFIDFKDLNLSEKYQLLENVVGGNLIACL